MLFACCCLLRHWLSIPSRSFLCAGQGSTQRQMHGSLSGERQSGGKSGTREKQEISELGGTLSEERQENRAICLGSSRTLGGLPKEMGRCVKGEWKRVGGGVEEGGGGGIALLWVSELSFFFFKKAVQWSRSGFVCR